MIAKKIQSILQPPRLQPPRRIGLWLPSVLLPLFALGLWGYLEHPDWLEATIEENASTGEILSTDSNSPVTEADLSIQELSEAAQTGSISDLVQQLSLPPTTDAASGAQKAKDSGTQTANAEGNAKNAEAQKETKPKPVVEVKNPFASAIQDFLNGGSTKGLASTRDPLQFAPLVSKANAMQAPTDNNALQQALAKLNNPSGAAESGAAAALSNLAANSLPSTPATLNPVVRGQVQPVSQLPSSSLAGAGVYIPGQMPSSFPGQAQVAPNAGFVAPNPMTQVYYPQQRGASGYQVTPGGTTYSRERGSTGSVVTPQGIIGPRDRGSTGSIITPQGTVYTRDRGTTGFTAPPLSTSSTQTTNSTSAFPPGSIPNNVPSPTVP